MGELIFLLFIFICIGFIYIIHKYFGKYEFYALAIIYTIISFLMSFKLINVFGLDINPSIIFSGGILMILYYFINRYDIKEYKKLILDNLVILIVFPISLLITLILSGYSFKELKKEVKNKNFKIIVTIIGLMFIDTFIFIYFSYAFLISFDKAIVIAVQNYFVKSIIMIIYMFIINKILSVKKVK